MALHFFVITFKRYMSKVLQCNICPTNGFNIQVFTVLSFFNKYFVSRVLHMQDKLLVLQTKTCWDVKIFCFPLIPKSKINIFTLKIYILEFSLSGTYHNVIFILEEGKILFKIWVNVDFNYVFYMLQIWFIGNYSTTRNCAILGSMYIKNLAISMMKWLSNNISEVKQKYIFFYFLIAYQKLERLWVPMGTKINKTSICHKNSCFLKLCFRLRRMCVIDSS